MFVLLNIRQINMYMSLYSHKTTKLISDVYFAN